MSPLNQTLGKDYVPTAWLSFHSPPHPHTPSSSFSSSQQRPEPSRFATPSSSHFTMGDPSNANGDQYHSFAGPVRRPHPRARYDPFQAQSHDFAQDAQLASTVDSQSVLPVRMFSPATDAPAVPTRSLGKQPPRPRNAWIIYRGDKLKEVLEQEPDLRGTPQAEMSKRLAKMWKEERADIRQKYELEASIEKEEHERNNPGYTFKPMKKADKELLRQAKKADRERERQAAKLKKEVEQQIRTGRFPANGMTRATPDGELAQGKSVQNDNYHKMLQDRFGEFGPSPPLSECPSSVCTPLLGSDLSLDEPTTDSASTTVNSPSQDVDAPAKDASMTFLGEQSTDASQLPALSLPSTITDWHDASRFGSAIPDGALPWSPSALGDALMNDWVNAGFPQGQQNDTILTVDTLTSAVNASPDDVPHPEYSIADNFTCDNTNPYAAQVASGASGFAAPSQQGAEAPYIKPFMDDAIPMDQPFAKLFSMGTSIDNALFQERAASQQGLRAVAPEHCVTYLPSPPESAPAISPTAFQTSSIDNDFAMQPTNLSASSSSQPQFSWGLERAMPTDLGPPGSDQQVFDFEFDNSLLLSDVGASGFNSEYNFGMEDTIMLPMSFDAPGCGFQSTETFNPLTPVSAGPTTEQQKRVAPMPMFDFSMPPSAMDDAWQFPASFGAPSST